MPTSRKQLVQRGRRSRQLCIEKLENRRLMAGLPYGALPQDTAEFMLGTVAVTPVFLESNGQVDPSTENWTSGLIQSTLQTVENGVNWWVDLLATQHSVHSLQFAFDTTYATAPVPTRYEPISRVSNDYPLWTQEFLTSVGFNNTGNIEIDMKAFNNAQRVKMGTDWAYTLFVINSNNDADGLFPPGGSFTRAFGFAGGLFFVSPSTRPASTFAHETGHQFWAKDEYAGGASYAERRGYYNTQNSNAADNPATGFIQQPSIMATGELLDSAYNNHVSAASTLAMVGWQDSDHDGVFDVLDVPLELTGTGYYDSVAAAYKFNGLAKVGVLPNLNPEGLGSDITLNRVSAVQYRVDNGPWLTVSQPDVYETELNLNIPLSQPGQVIEIRAIDAKTGITSNVFQGRFTRADAVASPGINGFVSIVTNGAQGTPNGTQGTPNFGEEGWKVDVLSLSGQPLNLRRAVEPDDLPDSILTGGSVPGVNITAVGTDADGRVGVFSDSVTSTGTKSFRGYSRAAQSWLSTWSGNSRRMHVDFSQPTSIVEIDAIGAAPDSYGRLDAYDATGKLVDRFTTAKLGSGQVAKMRVESAVGDIAYVVIGAYAKSSVRLDNLRFGPETTITTQAKGQYTVEDLPTGSYLVKVSPTSGSYRPATPGGDQRTVTVAGGSITNDIDFAFTLTSSGFQNTLNRYDVNADQVVSALDVLLIVNYINQNGPGELIASGSQNPPYLDVSGDGFCTALDALLVINSINSAGSGESAGPADAAQHSGSVGYVIAAPSSGLTAWPGTSGVMGGEGEDAIDRSPALPRKIGPANVQTEAARPEPLHPAADDSSPAFREVLSAVPLENACDLALLAVSDELVRTKLSAPSFWRVRLRG